MDDLAQPPLAFPVAGEQNKTATTERVAATAIACVLAVLAIGTRNLETSTIAPTAATPGDVKDVRIVDPAFCQDQTWPYIDQRCLKRAPPQETASAQGDNASPPLNIAPQTANAAPRDVTQSASATEQKSPSPIAAAETAAQSPPPVPAESSVASPAQTDPANAYSTTQTAFIDDSPAIKPAPKPRHARHHSRFFFGFRF
jgi:hypothetical protein